MAFQLSKDEPAAAQPIPDMRDSEMLPEAEPAWTLETEYSDRMSVHNDMLVRYDRENEVTLSFYDLATGEKTMSRAIGASPYWLSGDFVITLDSELQDLEVRDIRTGELLHTLEYAGTTFTSVVSGSVISLEDVGETASRLRAVDVATGKEEWTKDLDGTRFDHRMAVPSAEWRDDPYFEDFTPQESNSPIVFLMSRDAPDDPVANWGEINAIGVSTGEERWTGPIDVTRFDEPFYEGFQLTDDGDIHVGIVNRQGREPQRSVSYIIDSSTGDAKQYTAGYEYIPSDAEQRLRGDTLLTADGKRPAFIDISTGKVVWHSQNPTDELVNGGGLVFAPIYGDDPDRRLGSAVGTFAVDSETGEHLWAREGTISGDAVVAGDEVVAAGFGPFGGGKDPIQVFDRDTGKGKWQLDAGELVGHTSDHFVFSTETGEETAEVSVVPRD